MMNCKRCKTVELIRMEWPPMNLRAPWEKPPKPPVDRCPCCGLEWPVQASQRLIEPPHDDNLFDLYVTSRGYGALEETTPPPQDPPPQQLDLFSPVVGGFALFDE